MTGFPRFFALLGLLFASSPGCSGVDEAPPDGAVTETDAGAGDAGASSATEPEPRLVVPRRPDAPPPPGPCEDAEDEAEEVPVDGVHVVGDFRVEVIDRRALVVTHADAGDRVLFASPESGPALTASRTHLEVHENQGSFDVKEELGTTCRTPRFETAARGPGLWLEGSFEEEDPACRSARIRLRFCEPSAGHLAFELETDDPTLERLELRVAASPEERVYGAGEQFPHDTLDLRGRVIPVLSQEGGIGRGHTPITQAVNTASEGSGGSEGTTYYAAPHYLTSEDRSLFLENTEYAELDFRDEDALTVRLYAPSMRGRILLGDGPLSLIERFTEWAGRMPPPPDWVNEGAIVALAKAPEESLAIVDALRESGAAISAVWNQTWSGVSETYIGEQVLWNWIQNEETRPGWDGYVDALEARDIRVLCYVNSMFRDVSELDGSPRRNLYAEALEAGHLVRKEDGSPYLLPVTAFEVGLLDLSDDDARRWMKDVLIEEMLGRARCSGWMADFAEALPFDAVLDSPEGGAVYHNRYPVEWARLNREAIEEAGRLGEVLVFHRSGHTRSPSHALMFWQGDQLTTWDKYDGLTSALRGLISGGFSGISLNHSDVGGYTSLSRFGLGYKRETEQLKRWTEMSAFTALLRTHEGNQPGANAQVYDDGESRAHFARFTKVYRALAFYRRGLFEEAANRGWPVVRHLVMHYPDDPESAEMDDQFLLGSEILVAPIRNKCWTWPLCRYRKLTYFPPGRWVHLWSGRVYGDDDGEWTRVSAPIGEPAVFYRHGSTVGAQLVENLRGEGIEAADPAE